MSQKMATYYISTQLQFYGDAKEEQCAEFAEVIAARARAEYPNVEFVVTTEQRRHDFDDDDLLASVQQTINDNWVDWIA